MAQTLIVKQICAQCGGDGEYRSKESSGEETVLPCPWPGCNGTGSYEICRIEVDPGTDDISAKCDAIAAEQEAQRADLTSALNAIWNKVKDL